MWIVGCYPTTTLAQNAPPYAVIADGDPDEALSTLLGRALPPDDAARLLLDRLASDGFAQAHLDSLVIDAEARTFFVRRGTPPRLAALSLQGLTRFDPEAVRADFQTLPGRSFDVSVLQEDLRALLLRYERAGHASARAEVTSVERGSDGVTVELHVQEGPQLRLRRIEVGEGRRFGSAWAARVVGLRAGGLLAYEPGAVRASLLETGLFDAVGEPWVRVEGGEAVLVIPASAGPPGAFDLVLGYLPAGGAEEPGQLVGSGSLSLRNPFGGGRRLDLALVRNPGLVSSLDLRVSDPFILGLPLRLDGYFSGYQRDSTFSSQRFGVEGGFRLAPGLELIGTASRVRTEAGIAGETVMDGLPLVPDASAWRAGAGLRFTRLDRPRNPRRGLAAFALAEQGRKRRTLPPAESGAEQPLAVSQQFLTAEARAFVPTWPRQVLAIGFDVRAVLADVYDESDLFRLGGAASLRGYDEERFSGNAVGRAFVEYRYQLDRDAYAFAFFDLGAIRRPRTAGGAAEDRLAPGYGIGALVRTPVGLIAVSYALNPEEGPTRGNVHLGLNVGL